MITKIIGQEWCLCPFIWGVEDYIRIESSRGTLALCSVAKVISGDNAGQLIYKPLTKQEIHCLSQSPFNNNEKING